MSSSATIHRHRDRHRSRRADPKTKRRLRSLETFYAREAARLNALGDVAGVTRDELEAAIRNDRTVGGDYVDVRAELIPKAGNAAGAQALGIPAA